jgi:hypothetical protein
MANRYFSILNSDHAIFEGKHILQSTGTIYNGNLCMLTNGGGTGGSLVISTGSAIGMFFDMMSMVELPTSNELVSHIGGKPCNYAFGTFEALLGPDLFYGGSLPAAGDVLYDFGNGTIDASARGRAITLAIGKCMDATPTVRAAGSVTNTDTLALCRFDFNRILG